MPIIVPNLAIPGRQSHNAIPTSRMPDQDPIDGVLTHEREGLNAPGGVIRRRRNDTYSALVVPGGCTQFHKIANRLLVVTQTSFTYAVNACTQ